MMRIKQLLFTFIFAVSIYFIPAIVQDVYAGTNTCDNALCLNDEMSCGMLNSCSIGADGMTACSWCGTFCADACPTPTPSPTPTPTPSPTPLPLPFANCTFEPNLCLCQGKGKNLFEIPCDDQAAMDKCEASTRRREGGTVLRLIEDDASKFNIDCECDCSAITFPTPTPEPTGACCLPSPPCLELTQLVCEASGVYQGDGTTYDMAACDR